MTDAEEWLRAFALPARREILSFLGKRPRAVRHYRDLHTKVAALHGWCESVWSAAVAVDLAPLAEHERELDERAASQTGAPRRRFAPPRGGASKRKSPRSTTNGENGAGASANDENRLIDRLAAMPWRAWADRDREVEGAAIIQRDLSVDQGARLPHRVDRHQWYGKQSGERGNPPVIVTFSDFSFPDNRRVFDDWVAACRVELTRRHRPPQHALHLPTVVQAALDPAYRKKLFARVDWADA